MITSEQANIRRLLELWARCQVSGNGYPGACSIAYAADGGPGVTAMCSKEPRGVEVPVVVRSLQRAMSQAQSAGYGPQIAIVRAVYMRSHNATLDRVAHDHSISVRTLQNRRADGEAWLACHIQDAG